MSKRAYVLRNNHFNLKQKQAYRDAFIEYIQKDYLLDSLESDINEYIEFKTNCKYLSINIKKFNVLDCALKHYTLMNPVPVEFNNDAFRTYLYKSASREYGDLQKYFKHSDNLDTLLERLLNTCDVQLQKITFPKSLQSEFEKTHETHLEQIQQDDESDSVSEVALVDNNSGM